MHHMTTKFSTQADIYRRYVYAVLAMTLKMNVGTERQTNNPRVHRSSKQINIFYYKSIS